MLWPHVAYGKNVRVLAADTDDQHILQVALEKSKPGATIIPVIISSDKTQLTVFRNKSAYPVYITIGNIPKDIRRKPSRQAQILLGYLPVTSLKHIKNADVRRRALSNLFHSCMRMAVSPMKVPGREGENMASGDGVVRRCHPILAAAIWDYPEQVQGALVKTGECPLGEIEPELMGENVECTRRNINDILDALESWAQGPVAFVQACRKAGIKPIVDPFWSDLPFANPYYSIMPDILHQLYQGVVKHLIAWLKLAYGEAALDARFQRLPPNHNVRLFSKGISVLSRVSGAEHEDICRVLLGVIVDLPLPGGRSPVRVIRAVRSLLDFVYLAQYPSHTETTLGYMLESLASFHSNKVIFVELGIREHFNFPKMHSLTHYVPAVRLFGTADNFNTAYSERLHIDMAKDAYRASNRKDEYPQMTTWLLRREKIHIHSLFIQWRLDGCPPPSTVPPDLPRKFHIHIANRPNVKAVSFANAARLYGAIDLSLALRQYIVRRTYPAFTPQQQKDTASTFILPFQSVAAFHRIKFWNPDAQGRDSTPFTLDAAHARPAYRDTQNRPVPSRFDTVLIDDGSGTAENCGVEGMLSCDLSYYVNSLALNYVFRL